MTIVNEKQVDAPGITNASECVGIDLFDRDWALNYLQRDVEDNRNVLLMVRQATLTVRDGKLRGSSVLGLPDAKLDYRGPAGDQVEEAKLLGLEGEPFVVIRRAWADSPDEPKGTVGVHVDLTKAPGRRLNKEAF